jgi:hypothetical protein
MTDERHMRRTLIYNVIYHHIPGREWWSMQPGSGAVMEVVNALK